MTATKKIQVDEYHRVLDSKEYRDVMETGRQELESLMNKGNAEPSRNGEGAVASSGERAPD